MKNASIKISLIALLIILSTYKPKFGINIDGIVFPIKSIIVDLDDTLYEEKDFVISGFKAVVSWIHNKFNLSIKARNEINVNLLYKYYQENSTKVFNQLSDQWGPFPVNELINIYRNHVPEISLAEDAEEILLYLKGEVPLAIITDGFKKQQSNKIKALGLDKFFSLKNIIINEAPQLQKPSEKCFLQVDSGWRSA